jgi:hypothetical protein
MPQPPAYSRQANFTQWSIDNPSTPHQGVSIDAEFNAVKTTVDATLVNLAKIQRDDGAVANNSIGPDQLSNELVLGFRSVTNWATATAYVARDAVWVNGRTLYRCLVSHTSAASFATDLAANRWQVIADYAPIVASEATAVAAAATATSAANSATAALATFQGIYRGAFAGSPAGPHDPGDLYFDTIANEMRARNAGNSAWVSINAVVLGPARVTAADTTNDFLNPKLLVAGGLISKAVNNPGANETLTFTLDEASDAEIDAGANGTKVVTPRRAARIRGLPVSVQTANFNIVDGFEYIVDCTAGNVTATLPGSPATTFRGSIVKLGANRLTLARNGNKIMDLAEDLDVTARYDAFDIRWPGAGHGWLTV